MSDWSIGGEQREGVGILQTASHSDHRGQSSSEPPCVIHAGVSHQHPLPGCKTSFCTCIAEGEPVSVYYRIS